MTAVRISSGTAFRSESNASSDLPLNSGCFSNAAFSTSYQVVNTGRLAELYPDGGDVTPDDLVASGAVRPGSLIKVLGTGDAPSGLRVSAHAVSESAKQKIEAAGGTVTLLG